MTLAGASRPFSAQATLREVERLAVLLDTKWQIPGTRWRFGVDAVAGLLPGVGDLATGLVSAYLVYEAHRLGVSRLVLARMIGNVAIDTLVGAIPVLGSIFDFVFKANTRNLQLLRRDLESRQRAPRR